MKYLPYMKYFILAFSLSIIYVFINPQEFKEFWFYARKLLIVILFVRPLSDIFPKCKIFKYWVLLRREMWILMWMLVLAHGIWYFISKDLPLSDLYSTRLWDLTWYLGWGMLAWVLTFILAITSNNISVKFFWKKWKSIQRLNYLMFAFAAIHIGMVHNYVFLYSVIVTVVSYLWIFWLAEYYKKLK